MLATFETTLLSISGMLKVSSFLTIFMNLLENEFLDMSQVKHKPSKDAIIKGLSLLRNLRGILEEGMLSAVKRGPS